jgi:hypothetical protein
LLNLTFGIITKSGTVVAKRFENQIIQKSSGARKPKGLNSVAKIRIYIFASTSCQTLIWIYVINLVYKNMIIFSYVYKFISTILVERQILTLYMIYYDTKN